MAGSKRPGDHGRVREAAPQGYASAEETPLVGILLDSDVIIEVLRGRQPVLGQVTRLKTRGVPLYCTTISWAEVYAGIRAGEEYVTERFLQTCGEVVLDATVGRQAGRYLARYVASHHLELADAIIAAAASRSGLRLWTLNRKHFPMTDVGFYTP